ncbi:MAG TPA: hypothetical protein VNG12_14040 [Acidimicrobiales bacterium]|nr:hypothetical protein [Acidimicrobiales bacterium]
MPGSLRQRQPNVSELRVFLGRDNAGKIRFRLMPLADHDRVLNTREERRCSAERAGELARHRRNVAAVAANAKPR